jgi:hypothetical protein
MRSTMPEAARSGRHSSSRTVKNQRRGASPASASACDAATVPRPSDQAASMAAAVSWVSASPIREMSMQTAVASGLIRVEVFDEKVSPSGPSRMPSSERCNGSTASR